MTNLGYYLGLTGWEDEEEILARRQRAFDDAGIVISDALPATEDDAVWTPLKWTSVKGSTT